jgi:RimJ/RimL family protein N-acetyltransferase
MAIRRLTVDDAGPFLDLRRAALLDAPLAFLSSPEDDFAGSIDAVRTHLQQAPDAVVFGAFDPALVGVLGLYRDRHRKAAHKAHAWGMYVAAAHRGRGIAAALLAAVVAYARAMPGVAWVHLSVSDAAPAAARLYARAGFQPWGTEHDALRHEGRVANEHHLALRLD